MYLAFLVTEHEEIVAIKLINEASHLVLIIHAIEKIS